MQEKIDNQEGEMRKLRDLLKERDTQIEVLKSTLTLERSRLPHRHKKTDRHIWDVIGLYMTSSVQQI